MSRLTVVCGPPCSGKSTYVAERAEPGEIVLDFDVLYAGLTGLELYERADRPEVARAVWAGYFALVDRIRHDRSLKGWAILTGPARKTRSRFHAEGAHVVLLEVAREECLRRLADSDRPDTAKVQWRAFIDEWFDEYEPDDRDVVIR